MTVLETVRVFIANLTALPLSDDQVVSFNSEGPFR